MDVMFYEVFKEEEKELRRLLPKGIDAGYTWKTVQEADEASPPAGLISIRTQSIIPPDWAKKIKAILARSQGHDHLVKFRRETGSSAALGFLGNYCSRAVAEQAVLMMLALMRKLSLQEKQFASFSRDGLTGTECRGRKALVIGVGNIGREIVDIARGLKMDVKGVDIAPTLSGLEYVPFKEGLAWAEVVFCALSLTEQTQGMLNVEALGCVRTGCVFVNIARGEIAPLDDLQRLLEEGKIAGLGLDVYEEEGVLADALRAGNPERPCQAKRLLELSQDGRVVFTPHNAFNTKEALQEKSSLTVASVIAYLKEGEFPFPVPQA